MSERDEILEVVDQNDKVIGTMSWGEANRKNMINRAARILVFDNENNVLVQRRSLTKAKYPGMWDVGVSETLKVGEGYDAAAARGVKEELGIKKQPVFMFSFFSDLPYSKRMYHVYSCVCDGKIKPDKEEVEEVKFITLADLKKMLKAEAFTPTGKLALERYLTQKEYLTIVDEDDNIIGKATYDELKAKGLIHRAANVFVFNSKGEVFVHRRAENLNLYPGMWDVKFGGLVRADESYEDAALREMKEEAGITGVNLTFLFGQKSRRRENLTNRKVFQCTYNGKITLDKTEVAEGKFVKVEEAVKFLEEGKLSPSAEQIFEEFLKKTERK